MAEQQNQRKLYIEAEDGAGCVEVPNTDAVFRSVYGLSHGSIGRRFSGRPLGPVTENPTWWPTLMDVCRTAHASRLAQGATHER